MPSNHAPDLAEKVAYLRRPDAFPDAPDSVDVIETHFAWVFLSKQYAYKLKKPVRFRDFDLTTRQARRANCELEIALNRRLAAETYIGVVPLGRDGPRLLLESGENPVDWLVKMRRLPREAALERLLPGIHASDPRLVRLIDTLCTFYGRTSPAPWSGADYRHSLNRRSIRYATELTHATPSLDDALVRRIAAMQASFVDNNSDLFDRRIIARRVVDAHGDLRPEHIFFTDDHPQIIDCLEFSAELRQLDAAEELSFLALECERLGRPAVRDRLRELYLEAAADDAPERLFAYYRSQQALTRAALCAWHLAENLDDQVARRWLEQARWYIAAAESSIGSASC
jgi:aminoglycoside phosphotransferase family enzyme